MIEHQWTLPRYNDQEHLTIKALRRLLLLLKHEAVQAKNSTRLDDDIDHNIWKNRVNKCWWIRGAASLVSEHTAVSPKVDIAQTLRLYARAHTRAKCTKGKHPTGSATKLLAAKLPVSRKFLATYEFAT